MRLIGFGLGEFLNYSPRVQRYAQANLGHVMLRQSSYLRKGDDPLPLLNLESLVKAHAPEPRKALSARALTCIKAADAKASRSHAVAATAASAAERPSCPSVLEEDVASRATLQKSIEDRRFEAVAPAGTPSRARS